MQSPPRWAALCVEPGWIFAPRRMRESAATFQKRFNLHNLSMHVRVMLFPNESLDNCVLCPHRQNDLTHKWPHHLFTVKKVVCRLPPECHVTISSQMWCGRFLPMSRLWGSSGRSLRGLWEELWGLWGSRGSGRIYLHKMTYSVAVCKNCICCVFYDVFLGVPPTKL